MQPLSAKIITSRNGDFSTAPALTNSAKEVLNMAKASLPKSNSNNKTDRPIRRKDPMYSIWQGIKNRCYNPNVKSYPDYGARGITVCDRWLESFENFLADMGDRPTDKHTLDRRDNDKEYSPENCVWETRRVQAQHTRRSRMLTYQGRTQSMAAWCDELGLKYRLIESRTERGWPADEAFETPPCRPHERRMKHKKNELSGAQIKGLVVKR
jgi:hypothetical protein